MSDVIVVVVVVIIIVIVIVIVASTASIAASDNRQCRHATKINAYPLRLSSTVMLIDNC